MMKRLLIVFLSLQSVAVGHAESLLLFRYPLREDMQLSTLAIAGTINRAGFSTSNGEIWIVDKPLLESDKYAEFGWSKFAVGLRLPTALRFEDDGSVLVRQKSETTILTDLDGDGRADQFLVSPKKLPTETLHPVFSGYIWLDGPRPNEPFAGQYFGGSRSAPFLSRLSMVNNEKGRHSALFVFQKGLVYPVRAMTRLDDKTWLIAQGNDRDRDRTRDKFAVQRATWNDTDPFAVDSIIALDNGFEITFTKALLKETAEATWSYRIENLASAEPDNQVEITSAKLSDDGKSVTLKCEPPTAGQVYQISSDGNWSTDRDPVENPSALFRFDQ